MKTMPVIFILCCCFFISRSQTYNKGGQSIIAASQLIIENYTKVNLDAALISDAVANRFDVNNTATYLQVLTDNNGKNYHILLQVTLMGKICYLSISNNLSALFNKREKPMFNFNHCINGLNSFMSARQNIDAAVNCIVARLEYCSN